VVEPDVAQFVADDESQTVAVVVVQVHEQLVRQHGVVVAERLRGECVECAVSVGQDDVQPPPQPDHLGEGLHRLVQLGVLPFGELDRSAADPRPLGLPDDDQCGDEQEQRGQRGPDGDRPAGLFSDSGKERQEHGRIDDRDESVCAPSRHTHVKITANAGGGRGFDPAQGV
jgi:hypothetical protein